MADARTTSLHLDVITESPSTPRVTSLSADVITTNNCAPRVTSLSIDVIVPHAQLINTVTPTYKLGLGAT